MQVFACCITQAYVCCGGIDLQSTRSNVLTYINTKLWIVTTLIVTIVILPCNLTSGLCCKHARYNVSYVSWWIRVTHALTNNRYAFVVQSYEMNSLILTLIIRAQHFLSVGHISDNLYQYKLQLPHAACSSKQAVVTVRCQLK